MSELETGTASAASPAEAIADTPAAPTPETPAEPSVDTTLESVWDKLNPPRDDAGRFASKNPVEATADAAEPPAAEPEGQAPEAEAKEPETPAIPAPHSWPAEMKAKWDTLPPDAREYIAKRESEAHSQISRMGQQVKAFEPVANVLEQNRAVFERNGLNFQDGLNALLRAQVALENNPVAAIQHLANAYGVDLKLFGGSQDGNEGSPQVAMLQRQIADLQRQLEATSQRVMTREQAEQAQQSQAIEAQVNDFLKDKPDFDALEADILAHIPAIKATKPELSPKDILAEAYERAQWTNPEARARKLEAERKAEAAKAAEEARKRATEAKKAASTNVGKSLPVTAKPRSMEEDLGAVWDRLNGTR